MKGTKLTESDYHQLANHHGWRWIGRSLPDTRHKTLWKCPDCHVLERSYDHAKQHGLLCKQCQSNAKVAKIAHDYHLIYISGTYTNGKSLIQWRCEKGHHFLRCADNLKVGKHTCPVCIGLYQKNEADYQSLAESIGYQWVGDHLPENILEPTVWICDLGCVWVGRYNQIQRGKRCPHKGK